MGNNGAQPWPESMCLSCVMTQSSPLPYQFPNISNCDPSMQYVLPGDIQNISHALRQRQQGHRSLQQEPSPRQALPSRLPDHVTSEEGETHRLGMYLPSRYRNLNILTTSKAILSLNRLNRKPCMLHHDPVPLHVHTTTHTQLKLNFQQKDSYPYCIEYTPISSFLVYIFKMPVKTPKRIL